jgi:hypothetical protein
MKTLSISDIHDRIAFAMEGFGGRKALCDATGIAPATMDRYVKGPTEPPPSKLVAIAPFRESDGHDSLYIFDTRLAAGGGALYERQAKIGQFTFPVKAAPFLAGKTLAGYFVRGESMEPLVPDGSIVILDSSEEGRTIQGDYMYAFAYDDLARLKWVTKTMDGLTIRSENRERYPDEFIPADEANRVQVAGRALAVLKPI